MRGHRLAFLGDNTMGAGSPAIAQRRPRSHGQPDPSSADRAHCNRPPPLFLSISRRPMRYFWRYFLAEIEVEPIGAVDKAVFVSDVTIPDGDVVAAGTTISKTWRIRGNGGSSSWSAGYTLAFAGDEQMNGGQRSPACRPARRVGRSRRFRCKPPGSGIHRQPVAGAQSRRSALRRFARRRNSRACLVHARFNIPGRRTVGSPRHLSGWNRRCAPGRRSRKRGPSATQAPCHGQRLRAGARQRRGDGRRRSSDLSPVLRHKASRRGILHA